MSEKIESLSNDSVFYLDESLMTVSSPRQFLVEEGNIIYASTNYIIIQPIDSMIQTGILEIGRDIMELALGVTFKKSLPDRESKLVSTKYVHENYKITDEGFKTLPHRIDGLAWNNNKLEAAINLILYHKLPDSTLSGSNNPTKIVYDINTNEIQVNTAEYSFLDNGIYHENHFYLLGENDIKYNYSSSFPIIYTNPKDYYPPMVSRIDEKGFFDSLIFRRNTNTFDEKYSKQFFEFFEYDFVGEQLYFAPVFSDTLYTTKGNIDLQMNKSNNPIYQKAMSYEDVKKFRDYLKTNPFNFMIQDVHADRNNIYVLYIEDMQQEKKITKYRKYDRENGNLLGEAIYPYEGYIKTYISNDSKYIYSLNLDEKEELYFVRKTGVEL